MALVKPIISDISAFDATKDYTVTFSASGGDQIVRNEIKIVTNDATETVVYQNIVRSYDLSHVIPANTLQNSTRTNTKYYKVTIRTYDAINNTSAWSNYQPFYCYATPDLHFENISSGQTITNSGYNVKLKYIQSANEKVDYAVINLYDHNNVLVDSSGNMYNSDIPPLTFDYSLINLENHSQYYINAYAITVNGTIVYTDNIMFNVNYDAVITDITLTETLYECDGYVNLLSSPVFDLVGISNPDPAIYINNKTMIDMVDTISDMDSLVSKWVKFEGALSIPSSCLIRASFYPSRIDHDIMRLYNSSNTEIVHFKYVRGETEDYISIRSTSGTIIDHSLEHICNIYDKIFLWVKIDGDTWEIRHELTTGATNFIEWNDVNGSNAMYNTTTDIRYKDPVTSGSLPQPAQYEDYGDFVPETTTQVALVGLMSKLYISNGIFDELSVTKDIDTPYTTDVPVWDDNMILLIHFNGNLINDTPHHINKLVLKRKDSSLLTWLNLSEINVEPNTYTYINFNDAFIPTGVKQTYALVVTDNGVESDYITVEVTPHWHRVFISDRDNRFTLNNSVIYSNHSQNTQNATLMPIGAKYPIVIQNSECNYRSGSVQCKILGYNFDRTHRIDRIDATKQLEDFLAFLTNGKAKCITDYNGNIFICKVINSPQISFDGNYGNTIPTVSFDWVEQSKYNDYDTMLDL